MKQKAQSTVRKILPYIISFWLIVILIGYAPWAEVANVLQRLSASTVITLILLSATFYALKALRFWYLLVAMGIHQPLKTVMVSYMSAQPVSLVPGGEIYRSKTLQQHTGVPMKKSIAQFTTQGLLEGAGLATVMLGCAIALHSLRIPALILSVLVVFGMVLLWRGYMKPFLRMVNRLPFVHLSDDTIVHFNERHQVIFSLKWFPNMYGLTLLIDGVGATIAYISVVGLGGELNIYQAGLLYVVPVIASFLSLLPGGLGVGEQSGVAILLLSGAGTGLAVAATLLMRVTIVGLGVVFGGLFMLVGHRRLQRLETAHA